MPDKITPKPPPLAESRSAPATAQGLSLASAIIVVAVGGAYTVSHSTFSTAAKGGVAVITLVAFLGMAYALVQLILAAIATTGERRWFARQVSERRQGDRARKPRP